MTPATHVTINGTDTYRLGKVLNHDQSQIQCIGRTGLVHRVCSWKNGWGMGTQVRTSGDQLRFHRNGFGDNA
jgi:hypothetical protein